MVNKQNMHIQHSHDDDEVTDIDIISSEYIFDDNKGIRHYYLIPDCFFEDIEDYGLSNILNQKYNIQDLMLEQTNVMKGKQILNILEKGSPVKNKNNRATYWGIKYD